jgi:hypothetical protein
LRVQKKHEPKKGTQLKNNNRKEKTERKTKRDNFKEKQTNTVNMMITLTLNQKPLVSHFVEYPHHNPSPVTT